MVEPIDVILGFDPGGRTGDKFGWCICLSDLGQLRVYRTGRARNAEHALERVSSELLASELLRSARIVASGIDAPMFWTNTGERRVDAIIRNAGVIRDTGERRVCPHPEHQPPANVKWCPYPLNVQEINSLWGACLAQGLLLGRLLHGCRRFDAPITEAHPKALLCLLGICRADLDELVQGVEQIPCQTCRPVPGQLVRGANDRPCPAEDEEDAVLAAYAAWSMHQQSRGWRDLLREERNYVLPFGTPVSYWMPIP